VVAEDCGIVNCSLKYELAWTFLQSNLSTWMVGSLRHLVFDCLLLKDCSISIKNATSMRLMSYFV
jgi:hypothetical protein